MHTLTKEQEDKYLEARALICPFCGSANITETGYPDTVSAVEKISIIRCDNCHKKWEDQYKLVGISDDGYNEDDDED